jgi:hypothetical protein
MCPILEPDMQVPEEVGFRRNVRVWRGCGPKSRQGKVRHASALFSHSLVRQIRGASKASHSMICQGTTGRRG